jgi:hypothetical protein
LTVGVIIGVVVGYAFGTRAGEQGWVEFKEAAKVIGTSEEFRDLLAMGLSVGRDLVGRGSQMLAGALGTTNAGSQLRPVA